MEHTAQPSLDAAVSELPLTDRGSPPRRPETAEPTQPPQVTQVTQPGESVSGALTAGFQIVSQIVAQTTALVAVFYYFGWAQSAARYGYFGVSHSILRFSPTDYVLRSVNVVVRPVVIVGILVLLLMAGHRALSPILERHGASKRRTLPRALATALAIPGAIMCLVGLLGFYDIVVLSPRYPMVPVMLAIGIGLVAYGIHVAGFGWVRPEATRMGRAHIVLLLVLAAAFALWTVGVYAQNNGLDRAKREHRSLGDRAAVVVYSKTDLGLSAPGTGLTVQRLPAGANEYRYRYGGLRLLVYSHGRYVLLPDGWTRKRDPAFVLDERPDLRFELR